MSTTTLPGGVEIEDAEGHKKFISLEASGPNLVNVNVYEGGVLVGTPLRLKQGGAGRIAGDFPGLSGDHFILDDDGKLTNG